ncbi:MAG: thiamine phosphate synthase [Chloroflexi bacterium]|nr:thiamine phosphate synthase [Chloroflexota bacterium]
METGLPEEAISRQTLRIIDASLNRIGEGLRLLEELARFTLNDAALTQQLKTMRHELLRGDSAFNRQLLQARGSETDVGIDMAVPGEKKEKELSLVLVANSRRVQESLRTLEELAKVPGAASSLDSEKFKHARFALYTLEQKLMSKLVGKDKLERLPGLYVIIDTEALKGRSHLEIASQAIRGGARTIQLRDKLSSKKELLPIARQLKDLCTGSGVLFLMNDYLDIALAVDADGLHVGQDDLPVVEARRLLPIGKILGCSTQTVEEALAAIADGADHVAVGAIYPTQSKEKIVAVGLARLRQIRQVVSVPIVAIGGINKDNAAEVIAAGADSLAVISAVLGASSPEEAARQLARKFEVKK